MQPILTNAQRHLLRMIFDRGAEAASQALSKWLAEEVHLAVSEVELVELAQTAELLGPADSLVAACIMGLTGRLTGLILLVFEDRSGLALVDLLCISRSEPRQPGVSSNSRPPRKRPTSLAAPMSMPWPRIYPALASPGLDWTK